MISKSLIDTYKIAEVFLNKLQTGDKAVVIGLSGDLGSGKTTFSQYIAQILGVTDVVTSPTFIIEKLYHTKSTVFPQFIHIDAYRLDEARELEVLGFKEVLKQGGTLIFIEWPERVQSILPPETIYIKCTFIDETTREIEYAL